MGSGRIWIWAGVSVLMLGGCDLSKLPKDEVFGLFTDCDDKTWSELVMGGKLTQECRESLEEHLPENQTNHDERIVVLTAERADGVVSVVLHGIDSDRSLLTPPRSRGCDLCRARCRGQ
jgi:hypothetical protein